MGLGSTLVKTTASGTSLWTRENTGVRWMPASVTRRGRATLRFFSSSGRRFTEPGPKTMVVGKEKVERFMRKAKIAYKPGFAPQKRRDAEEGFQARPTRSSGPVPNR